MYVYENGYDVDNPSEPTFTCNIGIEKRGWSSLTLNSKIQYGMETRNEDGSNLNVSLLGLPKENDWILAAPYDDKTLLRDVLCYQLMRDMGWYSPRTKYFELYLDGAYMGIYVLTEKIKRDKNRVPISKNRNRNYLLETNPIKRLKEGEYYFTTSKLAKCQIIKYPEDPDSTEIANIKASFDSFEDILYEDGFKDSNLDKLGKKLNIDRMIDYMIMMETIKDIDAFKASCYWYKDEDDVLMIGPMWDCNVTLGNEDYYNGWNTDDLWTLRYYWANKLLQNKQFKEKTFERWNYLRENQLSENHISYVIDSLINIFDEAVERNFARWDIMKSRHYYNHFVWNSHEEEIFFIKRWFFNRMNWLDYAYFKRTTFQAESFLASESSTKIRISGNNTTYRIERSFDNEYFAEVGIYDMDTGAMIITDTLLAENTLYFYRVTSIDTIANTPSHTQTVVVNTTQTIPIAPTNLQYTFDVESNIVFSWNDNSFNELMFILQKVENDSVILETDTIEANLQSYTFSTDNIDGEYRLYSANPTGWSVSFTSIRVAKPEEKFVAYPSLLSEGTTVYYTLKSLDFGKITTSLINSNGESIYSFSSYKNDYTFRNELTIPQIEGGLYFLQTKTVDHSHSLKIIVQ